MTLVVILRKAATSPQKRNQIETEILNSLVRDYGIGRISPQQRESCGKGSFPVHFSKRVPRISSEWITR